MYISMLLNALIATALAAPIAQQETPQSGKSDAWQPAAGTKTTCDANSDKSISFMVGPQIEDVLNNVCAAMMTGCAYQDRLPSGTICIKSIDWPLDGPKSTTRDVDVLNKDDSKIFGFNTKFDVTPALQPLDSAGVFWTVEDCYGYFARMLQKSGSEGCHNGIGSGTGSVEVGGNSTLAGTVFKVTIVPEN
ncbi:hypothetical protein EJ02DRAFT_507105 [Clathrospora elynae]|uniref:Ecp2 effector protein domain-containing protein n=1 Tax=Clathrospora elynae TaxID=706981 RepID=A0A6A5S440_9PLEO|nr:hypothetical protein EJ02DRAFT_507105 [Clathrospora elynae]